jgi:Amino acid transporters
MFENLLRKKDLSSVIRESTDGNNGGLKRNLSAFNLVTLGIGAIVGTGIYCGFGGGLFAGRQLAW